MGRILVIAPHPDDEAIGLGGTLRRHIEQGDHVEVIFLTSGEKGSPTHSPEQLRPMREREAEAAANILGYQHLEFWRQPDGALEVTDDLVARLASKLNETRPNLVYVPHEGEMHPDHRAAARLVARAAASLNHDAPSVLLFEVWTPLQQFDYVEDISAQIDTKLNAIRAHKSQCDIMRFDEAAKALSRYRGEMHCWPGGPYAEVFRNHPHTSMP
ncbi:MAG: PIG-L deacetylase family protein [Verrucomicrobiales bacterium]